MARIVHKWHTIYMDATITLGRQGRLVIPAEIRATLGLSPGDRVHLHLDGHRLIIERPQDAVSELRRLGSGVSSSRSLVEELLAERHAAAESE
jgi:AbrB family looped-hinge helix DNA binding protein